MSTKINVVICGRYAVMILNELQLNFELILSQNDKSWNQFATVVFIWREYAMAHVLRGPILVMKRHDPERTSDWRNLKKVI